MGFFGLLKRAALKPLPTAVLISRNSFLECVTDVLREEAGYVDDRRDKGGATNRGITQAALAHFRGHPVTKEDVKALTVEEARVIYRVNYWNVIRGDSLPLGVDLCVFDAAVNSGPGRAARWLQTCARMNNVDGAIGPQTLAHVKNTSPQRIIENFSDMRRVHVRQLDDWEHFGNGWTSRILRVEDRSLLRMVGN